MSVSVRVMVAGARRSSPAMIARSPVRWSSSAAMRSSSSGAGTVSTTLSRIVRGGSGLFEQRPR